MALAIACSCLVATWVVAEACNQLGPHAEGYELASGVEPAHIGKATELETQAELADGKEVLFSMSLDARSMLEARF